MNQESTTRRAETPLEKRVISIINAAINEHNELSVASYGELVHRVVKLVEGQSAPAPQPVLDAGGLSKLESDVIQTAIAYHCHREDGDARFLFHEACSVLIEARYQSVKSTPVTTPDASEEWRTGAADSLMDRCRVYDAENRVVAIAANEWQAEQVVSDHRTAAAVPKLVEALNAAKRHIGSKPQAPGLTPMIDAALSAAGEQPQ